MSSEPTTPLISIVTVCLNAEAHIGRAMESVLAQEHPSIEHIIVDGGSTDATLSIIAELEVRYAGRLTWLSEKDDGLYDAMNKGVARARGELIGTLNADDHYEDDAVARVASAYRTNPTAGVFYGDLRAIDASGASNVRSSPAAVRREALLGDMTLFHPATFITATVYDSLGGYDTRYPIAADYDYMLRCAEAGVGFVRVDGVLTNFSVHGMSSTNVRATDRDSTRVRIAHGVSPIAAWARYFRRALAFATYNRFAGSAAFRRAYNKYKGRDHA